MSLLIYGTHISSFCFDRELLDKYISWVCYRDPHETPTFQQMLNDGEAYILDARVLYTEKSQLIVDRVYPYHQLDEALEYIRQRLGIRALELPRRKANYRPKGSNPDSFLSCEER